MNNQIILHFGQPSIGSELGYRVERRAIEWGCSIEFALFDRFVQSYEDVIKNGDQKEFMVELLNMVSKRKFKDAPSFNLGKFKSEKETIPMLVLEGDTVQDAQTDEFIQISDEIIDLAGLELEHVTGFEYLCFERLEENAHEGV